MKKDETIDEDASELAVFGDPMLFVTANSREGAIFQAVSFLKDKSKGFWVSTTGFASSFFSICSSFGL